MKKNHYVNQMNWFLEKIQFKWISEVNLNTESVQFVYVFFLYYVYRINWKYQALKNQWVKPECSINPICENHFVNLINWFIKKIWFKRSSMFTQSTESIQLVNKSFCGSNQQIHLKDSTQKNQSVETENSLILRTICFATLLRIR